VPGVLASAEVGVSLNGLIQEAFRGVEVTLQTGELCPIEGGPRGVGRFTATQPQGLREPASRSRQRGAVLDPRDQVEVPDPAGDLRSTDPALRPQVSGERVEVVPPRTGVITDLFQDGAQFALGIGHADAPAEALVAVACLGEKAARGVVVPGHPRRHGLLPADICAQLPALGDRRTSPGGHGGLLKKISGVRERAPVMGDGGPQEQRLTQLKVVTFLPGDPFRAGQKTVG